MFIPFIYVIEIYFLSNEYQCLQEYYPIEKIQPAVLAELPKKPDLKKRKIRDKVILI